MEKTNMIRKGQQIVKLNKKILFLFFCLIWLPLRSQIDTMNSNWEAEIGAFNIEVLPQFVGGKKALFNYLGDNAKNIENWKRNGTVVVAFWVNKDGSIEQPEIVRTVQPELDSVSLELIARMPKWLPGIRRGIPIKSKFVIPIEFERGSIKPLKRPVPSRYWNSRGSRKFSKMCLGRFRHEEDQCKCWHEFIIWNYNDRRLQDIDLEILFDRQRCEF